MTNWNDRSNWPRRAREALDALDARCIDTPAAVAAAVDTLRRVEAAEPSAPSPTALREAFLAGADRKTLDRLLLDDLGATRLKSEWQQAKVDAAGAVLAAIRASADEILPKLRTQAQSAIDNLTAVAALNGASLDTLVRSGRTDDARLLADVDLTASELDACYDYRDRFLTVGGGAKIAVSGIDCGRWTDPEAAAAHARGATAAQRYIAGLAAGLTLWFPSPTEAQAAARVIADRRAAAAEDRRQREYGVGSTVYLGA